MLLDDPISLDNPLRVFVQSGPLGDPRTDTTLALIWGACARGHTVCLYEPETLTLCTYGYPSVKGRRVRCEAPFRPLQILESDTRLSLKDADVILVRQDPPFDMAYLTPLYLLEKLFSFTSEKRFQGEREPFKKSLELKKPLIVNGPQALYAYPEKLACLTHFSHLMPPTCVTACLEDAESFFKAQGGRCVLKPLYGCGGRGVQRMTSLEELRETWKSLQRGEGPWLMLQAYLPDIAKGDKRILLLEGEVLGAINRLPNAEGLANMCAGGKAVLTELSIREKEICTALSAFLRENDLFFVGIDVIDGYLTEINTTSPTGLPSFMDLTKDTAPAFKIWKTIEKKCVKAGEI